MEKTSTRQKACFPWRVSLRISFLLHIFKFTERYVCAMTDSNQNKSEEPKRNSVIIDGKETLFSSAVMAMLEDMAARECKSINNVIADLTHNGEYDDIHVFIERKLLRYYRNATLLSTGTYHGLGEKSRDPSSSRVKETIDEVCQHHLPSDIEITAAESEDKIQK